MTFSSLKFKVQRSKLFFFSLFFIFLSSLLIFNFSFLTRDTVASHCRPPPAGIDCELEEIKGIINALKPAHERNKEELAQLRTQLKDIQARLNRIAADIAKREEDLALQEELLHRRVRSFYMLSRQYSPFLVFLASQSATEFTRELALREQVASEDRRIIEEISGELVKLRTDKARFESLQAQVDKEAKFLAGEVAKVESYLATLTARQQQLIALKLASLNLPKTLGAGPLLCVDDRDAKYDPSFRAAFAFYTFGIPHRVGMNQYGALGRAKAGQSAEQILQAYFQNIEIIGGFEGRSVVVNGTNEFGQTFNNESMNIEDYLKHLHEMPARWKDEGGFEALKAQAIAARSYALAEMNAKGFVYPSQKDQVIKKELNDGRWQDAVTATPGKIIAQGGQPVKTWYASTAGGYTFTSADVWGGSTSWTKRLRDTTGGVGNFSDLLGTGYDRESPCFYSAQGFRKQYSSSAWLKSEEVADIANVILLARADSSTREHLYQTDKPHPYGGEIWNEERVKQELRNRDITPFNSVSSVSVSADFGSGMTNGVTIGDAVTQSFSGSEFKDWFNLRAPANIQIVGPLYNVEKKG